jgi:HAD superfamily hydrolase (TIGR01490 family)
LAEKRKMNEPDVAFFDMDYTILGIDASVSWKKYLVEIGLAPAEDSARAEHFLQLYHQGRTPVEEFVKFQYREFIGRTVSEMRAMIRTYFEQCLRPFIFPEARAMINDFTARGIPTALVTGTNRYIAEPVAEAMKITTLLPTEPEVVDGLFTGGYIKPFLVKQAKLLRARQYCRTLGTTMENAAFFADSINDLELLQNAGFPTAVNPHKKLFPEAKKHNWPIKNWSV